MNPRYVAVTGAAGLLGSAVVAGLAARGHRVRATDRIDARPEGADEWIVGELAGGDVADRIVSGVDSVVHLAAIPNPVDFPDTVTFGENTASAFAVLDAAGRAGVRRAVVASSLAALGFAWSIVGALPSRLPIDEKTSGSVSDPYGLSKLVSEEIVRAAANRYGMDAIALRLPFIGHGERLTRHLRWFADDEAAAARETWAWLHTEDAVDLVIAAVERNWSGCHVLPVAADDTGSLTPTPDLVARYFPRTELAREVAANESLVDSSSARRILGFAPTRTWRSRS